MKIESESQRPVAVLAHMHGLHRAQEYLILLITGQQFEERNQVNNKARQRKQEAGTHEGGLVVVLYIGVPNKMTARPALSHMNTFSIKDSGAASECSLDCWHFMV